MEVRLIRPEEWGRTEELFALAFEQPMERKPDAQPDGRLHWAAFDEDGEMMSTLTVPEYEINFDGRSCPMGGIGGVATLPQYRRRGGIRGCFQALLPELYRRNIDFSYLYPFSSCFYRQFGYENCVTKQSVCIDLGLLRKLDIPGSYRLAEPKRDLSQAVRAVDAIWEERYNLAVRHRPEFYSWVREQDPAVKQEFCYVWFDADGKPGAYAVYRQADQSDGRNLVCSQFRFLDRLGYQALLELFRRYQSDHSRVKFSLPDDNALRYLMPEWSLGAASWSIAPAGMVRVVRVQSVLEKARYQGSGRVTIQITDDILPENSGCFTVEFRDGAAASVAKTDDAPDARLNITAFSALICGTCDFAGARDWMDGVEVCRAEAPLDRVFYKKPLFLADYF